MSSIQYSVLFPKKGLCSGFDRDRKLENWGGISIIVTCQNRCRFQDMIYQIRRDTKSMLQLMRGLLSWDSSLPHKWKRESRILPVCLERPHSSGTVGGCSERAGLCWCSCHQLSKTGQDRPNPAHLTDMMWTLLLLIASGQILICYRECFDKSEHL